MSLSNARRPDAVSAAVMVDAGFTLRLKLPDELNPMQSIAPAKSPVPPHIWFVLPVNVPRAVGVALNTAVPVPLYTFVSLKKSVPEASPEQLACTDGFDCTLMSRAAPESAPASTRRSPQNGVAGVHVMPQDSPGHVNEHAPGAPQLSEHPGGRERSRRSSALPLTTLPESVLPDCTTAKGGALSENGAVWPSSVLMVPLALRRHVPASVVGPIATLLEPLVAPVASLNRTKARFTAGSVPKLPCASTKTLNVGVWLDPI